MARIKDYRNTVIPPGQRFRARDGSHWQFADYAATHSDEPHVNLVSAKDTLTTKLISVHALFDKRLFRPID